METLRAAGAELLRAARAMETFPDCSWHRVSRVGESQRGSVEELRAHPAPSSLRVLSPRPQEDPT